VTSGPPHRDRQGDRTRPDYTEPGDSEDYAAWPHADNPERCPDPDSVLDADFRVVSRPDDHQQSTISWTR
jgi:hypothetical protein